MKKKRSRRWVALVRLAIFVVVAALFLPSGYNFTFSGALRDSEEMTAAGRTQVVVGPLPLRKELRAALSVNDRVLLITLGRWELWDGGWQVAEKVALDGSAPLAGGRMSIHYAAFVSTGSDILWTNYIFGRADLPGLASLEVRAVKEYPNGTRRILESVPIPGDAWHSREDGVYFALEMERPDTNVEDAHYELAALDGRGEELAAVPMETAEALTLMF